jgi:hypothetical protein
MNMIFLRTGSKRLEEALIRFKLGEEYYPLVLAYHPDGEFRTIEKSSYKFVGTWR